MVLTKDAPQSAIAAVRSSRLPLSRVIVVSNGSCDEADAELSKALPGIRLVGVRPARGISFCMNVGLRLPAQAAWPAQPVWTILTQDDIAFDADWLAKLDAAIREHPNALHINMAYPTNSYSCMAIHRDLVRKIGWWDERFTGMFFEDDDWHMRLCEYAKCAPGKRMHEKDESGIFARVKCALHDGRLRGRRATDRARFGFTCTLSKEPNREFFYKKWAVVTEGGWQGKGLPGLFARRLPEADPYPLSLLGGKLE